MMILSLLALYGSVDEEIYTGTVTHWLSSLCTGIMIE